MILIVMMVASTRQVLGDCCRVPAAVPKITVDIGERTCFKRVLLEHFSILQQLENRDKRKHQVCRGSALLAAVWQIAGLRTL